MSVSDHRRRHRVAVVALPGVFPFELGIPARVFGAAEDAAGYPLYEVVTCSVDGRPVATNADFAVAVSHDLGMLASADTIVVPPASVTETATTAPPPDPEPAAAATSGATDTAAATTPAGTDTATVTSPAPGADSGSRRALDATPGLAADPDPNGDLRALDAVAAALRNLRPGIRLASICTAIDVLAHAGVLAGRPATTHWRHAATFSARHPAVRLDPHVLYVDDGDVLTSAGAASGVDLCLHIIRRDHGVDVANRAARACVVPPHRDGGQAQYVDHPVPAPSQSSTAATRAWALDRLDTPITLTELAAHAAMSVRTFTRRFRAEVGVSPHRWLTQQRIALARRLLETTDLPVDLVAERAGLGTAASLRLHLSAALGVSPTAYRRTFHPSWNP